MADSIGLRQRQILELLLEYKDGRTTDEIAKALHISRTAVQQHIAVLELEGYLQTGIYQKTAGRPVRRYLLSEAGINSFPKQYAWFSLLILSALKNEIGSKAFRHYMFKLGRDLSESYQHRFSGKKLVERRHELVKIMDELGFRTLEKADPEQSKGLTITACNCIFHNLAQKHKEICQFDIALMTALLEKDVELKECMALGNGVCSFKIIE